MPFHHGEIEVQTLAGVRAEAEQLSRVISQSLKPAAIEFLTTQQFAVASAIASDGKIWASLLTGSPGFIRALDPQTVQIQGFFPPTDLLASNLQSNSQIGLLIIDLPNRRRLRLNGRVIVLSAELIQIQIQETFFNCPKYIQTRHLETIAVPLVEPNAIAPLTPPKAQTRDALNESDQRWITRADTFFIASAHPERGMDASHRGGYPGFVQVIDANKLVFPDYAGNNMFQTLGNLTVNPKAGLLFINFEQGHTLQLTGQTEIIWDTERVAAFAGAKRLVEFAIAQVLETPHATPLRWRFCEYSPANPQL